MNIPALRVTWLRVEEADKARGVVIVIDVIRAFLAIDRFAFAMVGDRERLTDVEYVRLRRVEVVET